MGGLHVDSLSQIELLQFTLVGWWDEGAHSGRVPSTAARPVSRFANSGTSNQNTTVTMERMGVLRMPGTQRNSVHTTPTCTYRHVSSRTMCI